MFRGITTQEVVKHRGRFGCVPAPKRKEKIMDIEKGFTEEKPFVRREDSAGLAQSEPKTTEEINLVCKIEIRTTNVIKTLNTIENMTNQLNKNLLPLLPKKESVATAERKAPQGWLEYHLEDLDCAFRRAGQIYDEVTRLIQEMKTNKVGQ